MLYIKRVFKLHVFLKFILPKDNKKKIVLAVIKKVYNEFPET